MLNISLCGSKHQH